MKTLILTMILTLITSNVYAKKPTSKRPTTEQRCIQLEKQYRVAKKSKHLSRHRLAEQLWVRCGK